jgi:RNA polymerase sigma-54 factor
MSHASLQQSLSQQQTLAPQMRKSLEILQASTLELSQMVRQALETNPTLEDITESVSLDEDSEENDDLEHLNETDDDWRESSITENRAMDWSADDEARRQHLYNSVVAPETLQQHLANQLELSGLGPELREAGYALIGNINQRGFLDIPVADLSLRTGIPRPLLDQALELLQSFDPPGIAAPNLHGSLILQLERAGEAATVEYRIVCDFLDDLARKRYPQIAKSLGTTVERVAQAAERISQLNPNPGGDYDASGNPFVAADVVIEKDVDGRFIGRLTNEHMPQLRISDFYKDMVGSTTSPADARQFIRDQIREGRTLIRSLSLRQQTILSIAEKIIEHQPQFLVHGPRQLRPLTMNEIADELGLHATTVSRAVAGKYIITPHGLMEMRAFFATGYQTSDGNEVSNAAVREAIQQLLTHESSSKPLSDAAIAKALTSQGIAVARRTVAKYREQLNILPSHLRKSFTG